MAVETVGQEQPVKRQRISAGCSQNGKNSYAEFLNSKSQLASMSGFEPLWMPDFLFPFQADPLTGWAIRKGRALIAADCGMGKTLMELVWCENMIRHTNRPSLLVTPLAVAPQIAREAEKFGIDAKVSRDGTPHPNITITNYERLHHFDPNAFESVACDESSILKSFTGARRKTITRFMSKLPYRLLCTARDPEDEKHVHPLQLDVIERAVVMFSNPGETVLAPFMGVGSEVYQAVKMGRRAIGIELKPSYWKQAAYHLGSIEVAPKAVERDMFAEAT